jgi:molybdate transport system permease protein
LVHSFWNPILISIKVSLLSTLIVLPIGILVAWFMARLHFWGKSAIETCLMLPLVLPPTSIGLFLLSLLDPNSFIGQGIEKLFRITFVFTYWGAVAATTVIAFPLVYQTFKTAFSSLDPELEHAARCDGANTWQVFRYIHLPQIKRSFVAAVILGFARSLGEFGATLLVAGNIPGRTQTVPMAMYMAIESGQDHLALLWAVCSAALSFVLLFTVQQMTKKEA